VSKDIVANLERAEVIRVGKAMAAERGLKFTTAKTGEYVSGTLAGSAQLGNVVGPARTRHAGKVRSHAPRGVSLPTPEKG
jgi:hypothetical protein